MIYEGNKIWKGILIGKGKIYKNNNNNFTSLYEGKYYSISFDKNYLINTKDSKKFNNFNNNIFIQLRIQIII